MMESEVEINLWQFLHATGVRISRPDAINNATSGNVSPGIDKIFTSVTIMGPGVIETPKAARITTDGNTLATTRKKSSDDDKKYAVLGASGCGDKVIRAD